MVCAEGENFSAEPGGLFEEPPTMTQPVLEPVMPVDPCSSPPQKNGQSRGFDLSSVGMVLLPYAILFDCCYDSGGHLSAFV